MASVTIGNNPQHVNNMALPKEGPRAMQVSIDFAVASSYEIDGQQVQARGQMSVIQGVYVNNRDSASPIYMTMNQTGQVIDCPAYSWGYFPLFLPNPNKLQVTSAGTTEIDFIFYNVPMPPIVTNVRSQFSFDPITGYALVSDPILEALISANQFRTQLVTDIADVAIVRIQTAAATQQNIITANPNWYMDFVRVSITPDAAIAVAGMVTWSIREGTNILFGNSIYLPAASGAAGAAILPPITLLEMSDLGLKGTTSNLNFIAGTALTSGTWNVSVGAVSYTLNQ